LTYPRAVLFVEIDNSESPGDPEDGVELVALDPIALVSVGIEVNETTLCAVMVGPGANAGLCVLKEPDWVAIESKGNAGVPVN
jgi:hypothetical protein